MKLILLSIIGGLAYSLSINNNNRHLNNNQGQCGTRNFVPELDSHTELRIARVIADGNVDEEFPTTPVEVVVNFHVIMAGNTTAEGNIPDEWMADQILVLNRDYMDAFQFVLNSTSRTSNSSWFGVGYGSKAESQMKQALRVGPNSALNVYTAKLGGGLLGWDLKELPFMDGVIIHFNSLPGGALAPYNQGRTLTHEAGHWFGLYHTFQDSCSYPNDFVEDTVAEREPAFGCPSPMKSCSIDDFSLQDRQIFSVLDASLNKTDAVTNFMDYTDDACMTGFSAGQHLRMKAQWPIRFEY